MATAISSPSNAMAETTTKIACFTPETLRFAAKQSEGIPLIPLSLRRAIKKFLREQGKAHMTRKVLRLSATASRELVEEPLRSIDHRSARWKIPPAYGDMSLRYSEDETVAYVASRMPAYGDMGLRS